MELSEIGKTTERFWKEIPKYFKFVNIDESVIMPNHIHGIIVIKNKNFMGNEIVGTCHDNFSYKNSIEFQKCRDAINRVSTRSILSNEHITVCSKDRFFGMK